MSTPAPIRPFGCGPDCPCGIEVDPHSPRGFVRQVAVDLGWQFTSHTDRTDTFSIAHAARYLAVTYDRRSRTLRAHGQAGVVKLHVPTRSAGKLNAVLRELGRQR